MTHAYKERINGRGFFTDPTGQKPNQAKLYCTQCNFTGVVPQKSLMPPEQIDKKFVQRGWELDPNICPTCVDIAKKARLEARKARMNPTPTPTESEDMSKLSLKFPPVVKFEPKVTAETLFKPKAATPTPDDLFPDMPYTPAPLAPVQTAPARNVMQKAASAPMAAMVDSSVLEKVSENTRLMTRHMHKLLRDHFSEDDGRYELGWDDARVAKECGLAPHVVANERSLAYGDFKEPAEIQSLRSEIVSLHEMADDVRAAVVDVEKRLQAFVDAQGFAS